MCVGTERFEIEARYEMWLGDTPSELCINADGNTLYWICDDIWRMEVEATRLPLRPVIRSRGTVYYGLTVDPVTSDIYIADAMD